MLRLLIASVLALSSSGCALMVGIGLGAERGRSDVVVRTTTSGVVYLERKPDAPRATVVLLHGFGGSKDHWTRFAGFIPDDVWVLAPDLPASARAQRTRTRATTSQHKRCAWGCSSMRLGSRTSTSWATPWAASSPRCSHCACPSA